MQELQAPHLRIYQLPFTAVSYSLISIFQIPLDSNVMVRHRAVASADTCVVVQYAVHCLTPLHFILLIDRKIRNIRKTEMQILQYATKRGRKRSTMERFRHPVAAIEII